MGRSGVKLMKNGLRVAYLSGIDFDIIGSTDGMSGTGNGYLGNYFTSSDLDNIVTDYELIVQNNP